jgi:hypothetical protein
MFNSPMSFNPMSGIKSPIRSVASPIQNTLTQVSEIGGVDGTQAFFPLVPNTTPAQNMALRNMLGNIRPSQVRPRPELGQHDPTGQGSSYQVGPAGVIAYPYNPMQPNNTVTNGGLLVLAQGGLRFIILRDGTRHPLQ